MKQVSIFTLLVLTLSVFSRSVFAQSSMADVEEIRQSVTNNSKVTQVVADSSVDTRLKELAEKEKNLEIRLTSDAPKVESKESEKSAPVIAEAKVIPVESKVEAKVEAKVEIKPAEIKKPEVKEEKIEKAAPAPAPVMKASAKLPEVAVSDTEKELTAARSRIAKLSKELDETKSRLLIAETEVERINASMDQRNRDSLKAMNVITSSAAPRARINPAEFEPLDDEAPVIGDKMTSAIPVATVIVERLSLKVGPTSSSSTLMQVNQGARLPIEGSQGNWYRVVAPTGARAWIPAAGVTIGSKN